MSVHGKFILAVSRHRIRYQTVVRFFELFIPLLLKGFFLLDIAGAGYAVGVVPGRIS